MKSDAKTFVALLFLSRDAAHKAHLNASTYSEHVALGSFYDELIDLADSFTEAWMGRNLQKIGDLPDLPSQKGEILPVLKRHLAIIEDIRDFVPDEDTALNNIIDEIVALYLSTLYKLTFLK